MAERNWAQEAQEYEEGRAPGDIRAGVPITIRPAPDPDRVELAEVRNYVQEFGLSTREPEEPEQTDVRGDEMFGSTEQITPQNLGNTPPPEDTGNSLTDHVVDGVGQAYAGMAAVGAAVSESVWDFAFWASPEGSWAEDMAVWGQQSVEGFKETIPVPQTMTGQVLRDTSELLTAAVPINRVAQVFRVPQAVAAIGARFGWTPPIAQAMGQAVTQEMAVVAGSQALFDPYEARLSTWLAEVPGVGPVVREFLVADPNDSEVEARLKMALEDSGMGLLAAGAFALLRGIRHSTSLSGRNLEGIPELPSVRDMGPFWTNDRHQNFMRVLNDPDNSAFAAASAAEDLAYRRAASMIHQAIDASGNPQAPGPGIVERLANEASQLYADSLHASGRFDDPVTIASLEARLRRRIREDWQSAPGLNTYAGQNVVADLENMRNGIQQSFSDTVHLVAEKLAQMTYDRSAPIMARLAGSPAGQVAIDAYRALSGAPAIADMYFMRARNAIYRPLVADSGNNSITGAVRDHPLVPNLAMNETSHAALDYIIAMRRNVSIAMRDPDYSFSIPGMRTGRGQQRLRVQGVDALDAFSSGLNNLRQRLGPERFDALNDRASLYFEAMRTQLAQLRDAGVITREQFEAMVNNEYQPLDMVRTIDPGSIQHNGMTVSVPSSGIKELSADGGDTMNIASADLLSQVISRTQGVIARNHATRQLYQWLEQNPNNGWLYERQSQVPRGRSVTPIAYMEDGVPTVMYMDREMADQWATHSTEISTMAVRGVQWMTGSSLTRLTATGVNPEFALVAFPRDMLMTYLTSGQYSPILPIAVFQQARNFASVIGDALSRSGRYTQWVEEGGSMSLLSHGERFAGVASRPGRNPSTNSAVQAMRLTGSAWHQLRQMLSFFNETGEIASRLMVREQGIRNGLSNLEATAASRRYLDYSQGGWLVKYVDTAIPYTNAAVQGIRALVREGANNPGDFMLRTGQFVGGAAALWYHNNLHHRDTMEAISSSEQSRYQVIPLGITRTDANGNVLHGYARIPIDPVAIPLQGVVNTWLERNTFGTAPDPSFLTDMLKNYSVLSEQTMLPPTLDALVAGVFNLDTYTGGSVWRGPDVPPEQEIYKFPDSNPTPQIMIDAGNILGMSPARLEGALSNVVAGNLYVDLANNAYNAIRGEPDNQTAMQAQTDMMMDEMPFLRRFVHFSYPRTFWDNLNQFSQYENAQSLEWNQQLDGFVASAVQDLDGAPLSDDFMRDLLKENGTVMTYITTQLPLLEQKRAVDRLYSELEIRQVVSRYADMTPEARETFGPDVTTVAWWSRLQWAGSEERAQIIYNQMRMTAPAKREQFMNDVVRVFGFSDAFAVRLDQLLARDGHSYDGWVEGRYDDVTEGMSGVGEEE